MRVALPKSLNGYLLLGIGVIAVPLLVAILHATFQMRQLADFSQALVNESVRTTELIQDMFEMRIRWRRSPALPGAGHQPGPGRFNDQDTALTATMAELRPMLRDPAARTAIDVFTALQRDIADAVRAPASPRETGNAAAVRPIADFGLLDDAGAEHLALRQCADGHRAGLARGPDHFGAARAVLGIEPADSAGARGHAQFCARHRPTAAPDRPRDQRAGRAAISPAKSRSAGRSTWSASATSSSGCATACSSWRRSATASCATCRTS